MTITAYGTASYAVFQASDRFASTKADVTTASTQLSSGKVATTYAGLGTAAGTSVALRAKMAALDDNASAIADGQLRLSLMNTSLTQIQKLAASLPSSLTNAGAGTQIGATSATASASQGLSLITDALNAQSGDRYLFSGRAADTRPVVPSDLMINGDATHDGLKTLISQRKAADAGTNGMGRLVLGTSGSTVSLTEEAAGLPFGMKIGSATATGTGVTAAVSGSPASASFTVGAQPATGDTLAVTLTQPDGTSSTITLIAGSAGQTGAVSYAIGSTTAQTAANISAALSGAVQKTASTDLLAASAMKSATDFFAATAANPPQRVAGPPYDSATTQVAGTAANTVIWYQGDTGSSPRGTAPVRISDSESVGIGAAANEAGFQSVLASFAVFAADSFPTTDTTSQARYSALASRVASTLKGTAGQQSVADIATDLSLAGKTMGTAKSANTITKNQLTDTLSGIEDADPTQTAVTLMAVQNRLQASYQTSSTILKLSLVNYL